MDDPTKTGAQSEAPPVDQASQSILEQIIRNYVPGWMRDGTGIAGPQRPQPKLYADSDPSLALINPQSGLNMSMQSNGSLPTADASTGGGGGAPASTQATFPFQLLTILLPTSSTDKTTKWYWGVASSGTMVYQGFGTPIDSVSGPLITIDNFKPQYGGDATNVGWLALDSSNPTTVYLEFTGDTLGNLNSSATIKSIAAASNSSALFDPTAPAFQPNSILVKDTSTPPKVTRARRLIGTIGTGGNVTQVTSTALRIAYMNVNGYVVQYPIPL